MIRFSREFGMKAEHSCPWLQRVNEELQNQLPDGRCITGGNALVYERSEPYPNPNQPLGASILASRQVERLNQTLRGVLNEDDRQLLTMQQQSWLGGLESLDNYGDRVAYAQMRIAELRQRLKEALQKKTAE
jgi:hypothetical protein